MPDTLTKDDNVASDDIDEFMLISLDAPKRRSSKTWMSDLLDFGHEGCLAISW